MNKLGKANPVIWIVVILLGVYFAYSAGYIGGPSVPDVDDDNVPSDLQCSLILKFKDALATTDTNVNASYIIFNGDGTFYDELLTGVGTDGKDTATVRVNTDYDIWAFNQGVQSIGFLAKEFSVNCGNDPKHTVTTKLVKRSTAHVLGLDDPVDLDQNITGAAGATEEFRVKWNANVSNAGVKDPYLVIDANGTSTVLEDLVIAKADSAGGKWSEVTCPGRINPFDSEHKLYCWKRDKQALSTEGVIITYVSALIGSAGPDDDSWMRATMADTAIWFEPGYDNINGVNFGAENDQESDVGAVDGGGGFSISYIGFND